MSSPHSFEYENIKSQQSYAIYSAVLSTKKAARFKLHPKTK